eukprot:gene13226-9473_t
MNTRQLSQGMKPTLEFERMHTFKSFRQFPELRKSVSAIENIAFASADPLYHMRSGAIRRKKQQTSTHRLAELSQSSLSDVSSVMDDFRRIMIDNRRKNMALTGARPLSSQSSIVGGSLGDFQSSTASLASSIPQRRPLLGAGDGDDDDDDVRCDAPFESAENDDAPQSTAQRRLGSFVRPPVARRASFFSSEESQSADPLLRANNKLKKVAVSFDSSSYNSHLAGFQGAKLQKQEFHMLLRRCLNIHLKSGEFDALFSTMDADGSGLIDGVEFIRYFFHLGNEAKALIHLETKDRQRRRQERVKEKKERARLRELNWQKAQIASFAPGDVASMHAKLQRAAFLYDPNNDVDHSILHRLRAFLSPYEFQLQVTKCFSAQGMRLHFTGPELAALIYQFRVPAAAAAAATDDDGDGGADRVDSAGAVAPRSGSPGRRSASPTLRGGAGGGAAPSTTTTTTTSQSPPSAAAGDEAGAVITMTQRDLDAQVDGYAFVTHFVHLSQAVWKAHAAEQRRLQYKRQRVLEMGQHTDIMPKSLGR